MANYGISASQEGIDLKVATDAQRVIDSRWRYLDIIKETVISFGDSNPTYPGDRVNLFQHDLGFVPAFDCYNLGMDNYINIFADNKYIYHNNYVSIWDDPTWQNTKAIVRIYNIPIMEEYSAPISQTVLKSKSTPSEYGVKILNPNKSGELSNNEMADFSLNTMSKGLAVQKTGTQVADSTQVWGLTITHGLSSPPIFLITSCAMDKSSITAINPNQFDFFGRADQTTIMSFRGVQSTMYGRYAYIIFKELADFAI